MHFPKFQHQEHSLQGTMILNSAQRALDNITIPAGISLRTDGPSRDHTQHEPLLPTGPAVREDRTALAFGSIECLWEPASDTARR